MNINNPSFWVLAGFFALFLFVGKKIWIVLTKLLDNRSQEIASKIKDASRMREEALALLNTCKRQQIEATEQAAGIMAHAEEEAERLRQKALDDAALFMEIEERLFQERLKRAEQKALDEIKEKAILVAGDAVRDILKTHHSTQKDKEAFRSFCEHLKSKSSDNFKTTDTLH